MTEEFNFREAIRNNPRIVNENDLQKMEYIELSLTGELIPVEEVEEKFEEFIRKLNEDLVCNIVVWLADKERIPFDRWLFERVSKLAGDKLK